ncbi:MAG: DnaJ domain-containing protein [Blastocatellia bacterium]|nr:DnaJ domain-containing protein [Blastocatellia bacterium]MBO0800424.1 DnaJ domain-containing protein [Blastocatellia bacterium]
MIKLPADNPYKVLGVERTAGEAEIKKAYFRLLREHPPERDPEGFKQIRAAYEKLRAGAERAVTDLFLIEEEDEQALSIQKNSRQPPPLTAELIRIDQLALEAELIMEELSRRP